MFLQLAFVLLPFFFFAKLDIPTDSVIVITVGSPSGIAATASDEHSIIISSIVYLLIKARINIKTKIINTIM